MLEKNGRTTDSFPGDVTAERITALQVFSSFPFSFWVLFLYKTVPLVKYESGNVSIIAY